MNSLSADELAGLRESARKLADSSSVTCHQGCAKNAVRMLDHIGAQAQRIAALEQALNDAPSHADVDALRFVLNASEATIRRLEGDLRNADALVEAVAATRAENTNWSEFNTLLAALSGYRTQRQATQESST